jgi:mannose-6-phosphate isomerase class I
MPSTYDRTPEVQVPGRHEVAAGWDAIAARVRASARADRAVVAIECYPGVSIDAIVDALVPRLAPALVVRAAECLRGPDEIAALVEPHLGDDPVFGRMNGLRVDDFLAPARVADASARIDRCTRGLVLVAGTGATLVHTADLVVYADLPRWEIQQRQRRHEVDSLGARDRDQAPGRLYKRAFFVDWRAADRLKRPLLGTLDFLLDTTVPAEPRMVSGDAFREGLARAITRPFRVVPFFDPGPWGGQWMKEVCDLPRDAVNYAWCFDCVPEENGLRLAFGGDRIEVPAIDLVFAQPRALLGDAVHGRFGAEFPIRFDFLDTMGGDNLSLQVHPLTEYIHDRFGMTYTQDESYYLLDAGPGAEVYLGLREGVDRDRMAADLRRAQQGAARFPDATYVNRWPARKHDHFLIPGGTIHCSGADSMVLEISATPYIFTFKLWDWDRLGLDGRPRPIHLDHGLASIQWDRTAPWVERELVNRVSVVARGEGWVEERTGLHEREFIETRRHWFDAPVPHATGGGVNVLNLVEGAGAIVESPTGRFEPFEVHYAETFIVPAAVGDYTIRPARGGHRCATMKAFVRTRA